MTKLEQMRYIIATLVPITTIAHIDNIRTHYTDIRILNNLLIK